MIIGSGLLAQAFSPAFAQREDVCVYAAGVSNSSCTISHEFARERERLLKALGTAHAGDAFVYFSTCSIADPEAKDSPYVRHKLAMEQLVAAHPRHLILRLPQVAGRTPNPHTLLNYLYAHISRSEMFQLWRNAYRNIIDVDDVAAITCHLLADPAARNITLNIANPDSYPMTAIVSAMENIIGKQAVYEIVERGSHYPINIREILPVMEAAGVKFGNGYLDRVIGKYYGKSH
ncbi:MAG: NAD-dependent epimerase/dehydratase family protein [Sideroxydans sp.]|nr:NAD-dependent epimerase/dehydratase family protein [Sideroxydans sp.]